MEGDVGQPELLRAVRIADTEIHAFRSGQISREAPNHEVVFRGYGTGDAAAKRKVVFTYTQALLHDPFEKGITDNHQKRTLPRQVADGFRERYDFAEALAAFAASKYMLLDGFFIVRSEDTKPVVGEKGGVQGIRADHAATPIHARS